jgi:hypothetical protein
MAVGNVPLVRQLGMIDKTTRQTAKTRTSSQEFAFCIRHRFNHVLAVARVEKKLAAFGIRNEFNEIGVSTNRQQKVEFIDTKHPPDIRKRHWGVIFEFEGMR